MPFLIDREVKKWGKSIIANGTPNLGAFDLFYIFFWVGLATGKKIQSAGIDREATGTGKSYTKSYKHIKEMLAAVVVISTSKSSGFTSQKTITSAIDKYMDSDSETELSSHGEELMMSYVQGGFEHMRQLIKKPTEADLFVHKAYQEIEKGFAKNKDWNFSQTK